MKFKIGDRVKYDGHVGTIKQCCSDGSYAVEFDERLPWYHNCCGITKVEHGFWCIPDELEKVKPETIVIYRKDNEVIALDKSTGKKAIAKCSPEDEFDFQTGAKLAFERLTETGCIEVKRYARKGDYVKIVSPNHVPLNDDGSPSYKKGDILKIIDTLPFRGAPVFRKGHDKTGIMYVVYPDEYVVLEGYKPEEPTYYNGKIIFTKGDDIFKTGHIYEVKDGKIKSPETGHAFPRGREPFENIHDIEDYFNMDSIIPGKWSSDKTLELIEVQDD